jgi:hypothetical protein
MLNRKIIALGTAFSTAALTGITSIQTGYDLAYEAMDDAGANVEALPGNYYSGGIWEARLEPGVINVHGQVFLISDMDHDKMEQCEYDSKTYHFFGAKIASTKGELKNCTPAI